MMTKRLWVFALALAVCSSAWATATTSKEVSRIKAKIIGDSREVLINAPAGPAWDAREHQTPLDVTGTIYQAGTTWYDYQHNGTAGKMIDVDDLGFVHIVWMNGFETPAPPNTERHSFYNVWDPSSSTWLFTAGDGGVQIDNASRSGYVAQTTTPDGFCFPAYHAYPAGETLFLSNVSIDFLPQSGAFTAFSPTRANGLEILWPKIALDDDGTVHMISTANSTDIPQGYYYSKGTPIYDSGFGLEIQWTTFGDGSQMFLIGDGEVISPDVACSPVDSRVALVWHDSQGGSGGLGQMNNDLLLSISEDGGLTWDAPLDVTDWILPDNNCASGDTMACNGDTLRPYTDASIMFDADGYVHLAFTTRTLYLYGHPVYSAEAPSLPDTVALINLSGIWHWSEEWEEFSPIAKHYEFATFANGDSLLADDAWQLMVQRPSLGMDPTTGDLYCTFVKHDSAQYSDTYNMSADAFVTKSWNNGRNWYEAINISETVTPVGATAGECNHERDVTLATEVTYVDGSGYLHISHVLDTDVGGFPQDEGETTECPVNYQRVPLADLAFADTLDPFWPTMHVDSTGIPYGGSAIDETTRPTPTSFALYQNYPNPFNPTTNIHFDIAQNASVTLKVFNVLGEEVATVLANQTLSAGAHTFAFDGANLSSGVYVYRLEANGVVQARKMMLMK